MSTLPPWQSCDLLRSLSSLFPETWLRWGTTIKGPLPSWLCCLDSAHLCFCWSDVQICQAYSQGRSNHPPPFQERFLQILIFSLIVILVNTPIYWDLIWMSLFCFPLISLHFINKLVFSIRPEGSILGSRLKCEKEEGQNQYFWDYALHSALHSSNEFAVDVHKLTYPYIALWRRHYSLNFTREGLNPQTGRGFTSNHQLNMTEVGFTSNLYLSKTHSPNLLPFSILICVFNTFRFQFWISSNFQLIWRLIPSISAGDFSGTIILLAPHFFLPSVPLCVLSACVPMPVGCACGSIHSLCPEGVNL